jgi:hypothetical protein
VQKTLYLLAVAMMLAKLPWNRALDEKVRAAGHPPNAR